MGLGWGQMRGNNWTRKSRLYQTCLAWLNPTKQRLSFNSLIKELCGSWIKYTLLVRRFYTNSKQVIQYCSAASSQSTDQWQCQVLSLKVPVLFRKTDELLLLWLIYLNKVNTLTSATSGVYISATASQPNCNPTIQNESAHCANYSHDFIW